MGYEITAILIDEARVRAFYECKDEAQVAAVSNQFPERIANRPELADGVRALAFGTAHFSDDTNASLLRYALALVCEHLGERLDTAIRVSPPGLAKAKELGRLLSPGLIPMPISREGDFPVVGFLSRQQIGRKLGGVAPETLDNPTAGAPSWLVLPKGLATERATYVSWLRRAAEKNLDLVAFYH